MAYCVLADIQAEFKSITFNSSANVTDVAVGGFINEASAVIDSYVSSRYETPITGTASLLVLSLYCRSLVANRVRGILATKQTTNADANQNVSSPIMTTNAVMSALKDLASGASVLTDATLNNVNASFYSNNQQNNVRPVFRKSGKQW